MARANSLFLLPLVVSVGLGVMAWQTLSHRQTAADEGQDPNALPSMLEGHEAGPVNVVALGDLPAFTAADLKDGKVKIVNFWASWCAPCRVEHPNLKKLSDAGVRILGVNYKDKPEAATSPFLLWHAQDAKAYSLLLLMVSVLFLAALHALRTGGRAWLWVLLIALISVFVHRLALLAVASAALGVFFETRGQVNKQRMPFPGFRLLLLGIAVLGAIAGLVGTMRAAGGERAFISRSGVGPFQSLWLTLLRFSVDRWPGDLDREVFSEL